ncbi:MAG: hypothetical protein ACFBSG_10885 [Leptolyngbyaceae cyanobacterium]
MEAKALQEENALKLLTDGTAAVDAAKQQYQTAADTQLKTVALAEWQQGMDLLNEIPSETLAGRMSATRLEAYRRDFGQVSGLIAGDNRASTLIQAAKEFAWTASSEAQNPPHSAETWQRIAGLWQQAIARLEQVPVEDVGYSEAQRMIAEYQNKLGVIREQQIKEQRALEAFESAQTKNAYLGETVDSLEVNVYASELQSIANELNKVEPGTTSYGAAQQLLKAVQGQLREAVEASS